jgi:predicted PurR-regulated permease PerM
MTRPAEPTESERRPSLGQAARETLAWNDPHLPRWAPRAAVLGIATVATFLIGRKILESISTFLLILLSSLFLSFAIEPAVDWLAARGWRRGPATALVFVVIVAIATALIWLMVALVTQQVRSLIDHSPQYVQDATNWVNRTFKTHITTEQISEEIRKRQQSVTANAGDVGGRVLTITGSVLTVVFHVLTAGLFTFYLVADGPKVRRSVCSVLKPERQRLVLGLWDLAIAKTGGYLYSRALLGAVAALLSSIAFSIIGVPSPVALGLFLGVTSQFVPVVGTYIGGALPAIVALSVSPVKSLWVIGYVIVQQQLENYFLAPKVTARTMEIHPAVAFGSAIVGASLIGPVGALLALPMAAIVQAFVSSYLHRYDLVEGLAPPPEAQADAGDPDVERDPDAPPELQDAITDASGRAEDPAPND